MGMAFDLETAAFIDALGAAASRTAPRLTEDRLDYTDIIVLTSSSIFTAQSAPGMHPRRVRMVRD
jgi:hypothetical protein